MKFTAPMEMILAMILSGTIGWFVLESGQSPYTVVFYRCLFGALSLAFYCWIRGLFRKEYFGKRDLMLMGVGGACLVGNWLLLFSSYRLASISIATIVYHTQPFYLLLMGAFLFKERMDRHKVGALMLAFLGVLFVSRIDFTSFSADPLYLLGMALALGAALLYTIASLITKRMKHIPPHILAWVQVTLGIFLLAPFVDFSALGAMGTAWTYLVTLGLVHTCLMYILLYSAIQKLPIVAICTLSFLYPAVAVLIDLLVYGRRIDIYQMTGMVLILLGAMAVNLQWKWVPSLPKQQEKKA